MRNEKKTRQLLTELSAIGEEHYKPEYKTGQLRFDAIGLTLGEVSTNAADFVRVAYAALEDWNHHSICAVLDYILPQLHPMSDDSPAVEYLSTLKRVEQMMNTRGEMKVFTDWNSEKCEYQVETYRLVVTLEKVS